MKFHRKQHGWGSLGAVFFLVLVYRVTQSLYCQSYFVADEYWQSLEVAHRAVFGYGELTWEWQKGIRSAIFPAIFTGIYRVLKVLNKDSASALMYVPRVFMACLLTCQDFLVYWIGGMKMMLVHVSFWSSAYFGTRTISNAFETLLYLCVMCFDAPLCLILFSFWVRPTSLVGSAVFLFYKYQRVLSVKRMTSIADLAVTGLLLAGLPVFDFVYYSSMSLTSFLTPVNFMYYNFVKNWAVKFGTQPIYFYFVIAVPQIMVLLTPFLFARKCRQSPFFVVAMVNIAVLSLSPHKEIRYLAPVVPFLILAVMSANPPNWILAANAVVQLFVFLFLSRGFLVGQTRIMDYVAENPAPTLFLLPCYSTPGVFSVHVPVELRVLQCNPANDFQEAHAFIENPLDFVYTYMTDCNYTRIVTFASYAELLKDWLALNNMKRSVELFNSYFTIDGINNSHIVMYEKQSKY